MSGWNFDTPPEKWLSGMLVLVVHEAEHRAVHVLGDCVLVGYPTRTPGGQGFCSYETEFRWGQPHEDEHRIIAWHPGISADIPFAQDVQP